MPIQGQILNTFPINNSRRDSMLTISSKCCILWECAGLLIEFGGGSLTDGYYGPNTSVSAPIVQRGSDANSSLTRRMGTRHHESKLPFLYRAKAEPSECSAPDVIYTSQNRLNSCHIKIANAVRYGTAREEWFLNAGRT